MARGMVANSAAGKHPLTDDSSRALEEQLVRRCYTLLFRLLGDVSAAAHATLRAIERAVQEPVVEGDVSPSWPRLREAAVEQAFVWVHRNAQLAKVEHPDRALDPAAASLASECDALLLGLPLLPRIGFVLRYGEKLSVTEIAEILATDVTTVDGLRRDAWRNLRALALAVEPRGQSRARLAQGGRARDAARSEGAGDRADHHGESRQPPPRVGDAGARSQRAGSLGPARDPLPEGTRPGDDRTFRGRSAAERQSGEG